MARFPAALLAVAIWLVMPTTTRAAPIPPERAGFVESPIPRAIAIADAYWGKSACGGNDPVVYFTGKPTIFVDAGPDNQALAEGKLMIGAYASMTDPTCTIHLNGEAWTPERESEDFQHFCDVITHEIGHFLGHEDTGQTDPTSIEYPTVDAGSPNYNAVPGCIVKQASWAQIEAEDERSEAGFEARVKAYAKKHRHRKSRRLRRWGSSADRRHR